MIRITKEQIKEIADYLDSGLKCYVNKETGIIVYTPDFDSGYADEELWEETLNELEENWDKYAAIDKMESHESFEIMADYAESVDSRELRDSLIKALNRKHPFQNFKWVVDNSGPYRQKWFDFKKQRLIEWVKNQLEVNDNPTFFNDKQYSVIVNQDSSIDNLTFLIDKRYSVTVNQFSSIDNLTIFNDKQYFAIVNQFSSIDNLTSFNDDQFFESCTFATPVPIFRAIF